MVQHFPIELPSFSRGFHLITDHVLNALPEMPEQGLVHLFIQHTSAALAINENADPTVLADFQSTFDRLVPENQPWYTHKLEGPDDMPAHIKAALLGASVSFPILNGQPAFGTWQGIYLCEFRNLPRSRRLLATLFS